MSSRTRLAMTAASVAVVAGCGRIAGIEDYSVGTDSDAAAPVPRCGGFEDGECGACIEQNCCTEADACRADEKCRPFAECMASCREENRDCGHRCMQEHEKTDTAAALIACRFEKCGTRCMSCGDLGNAFGPDCNDCIAQDDNRCAAETACLDDSECAAWMACTMRSSGGTLWEASDPASRLSCWSQHPDGKGAFGHYSSQLTECTEDCQWGKHWSCSTTPDWPIPTVGLNATVKLKVVSIFGGPPLANVTVQPCRPFLPCEPEGLTDHTGLTFSLPEAGTPGYYYDVSGPGLAPELYYPWHSTVGTISGTIPSFLEGLPSFRSQGFDVDGGVVFVLAADCVGSWNTRDPESTGVTFTSEPLVDGPYYLFGTLADRNLSHGQAAVFFGITTDRLTIRGKDPTGRDFPPAAVSIRKGGITFLSINAQAGML